jgi:YbbR domain-containing protein
MKPTLKQMLVHNWGLKLVALVLALALWLVLIPQDKILSEKTLTVPLETRNIPEGLEVVERPTSSIDVTVRAPSRLLGQITPATLSARLDLERATVYQQDYPLNKTMIMLPPGAEVMDISPNKVVLKLEKTRQAAFEIHPAVRGKPATGFRLSRIEVEPPQVLVQGAESRMKAKGTVTTAPVDISGISKTTAYDVDVILPKPELRLASAQTTVRVTITIEEDKGNGKPADSQKK